MMICSFQIPCITLVGSVVWFGERYIPSVVPSLNQLFDRKTQDTLLTHRNNHLAQKSGMIAKEAQLVNVQVSFHCREDCSIANVKTGCKLTKIIFYCVVWFRVVSFFFPYFHFSHVPRFVAGLLIWMQLPRNIPAKWRTRTWVNEHLSYYKSVFMMMCLLLIKTNTSVLSVSKLEDPSILSWICLYHHCQVSL